MRWTEFSLLVFEVLLHVRSNNGHKTSSSLPPPIVTNFGLIQGRYYQSRNGLQYPAFLGIKYGIIPQRFHISKRVRPWSGVLNATTFGSHCAQVSIMGLPLTGVEDCLFLNVFTPKVDNGKRPVLFYVHGGGFSYGSATELGAGYLVDEDIVLVTFHYRLGILGFLNTRDDLVPGNMGLKDQVLALKWVNKHISAFGGDPSRITISGNSAGSASVFYLLINPAAQGLFSSVYASSGSFLNPWAFVNKTVTEMVESAENLECNTMSNAELVKCLREEPLENLMLAQMSLGKWNLDRYKMRPSIDFKSSRNPKPIITKYPKTLLLEANFTKVPILVTMTKDEGIMLYAALVLQNDEIREDLNSRFSQLAPITFLYNEDPILRSRQAEVTNAIRQFYLKGGSITKNTAKGLTDLYSDTYFTRGIHETVEILGSMTSVYTGLVTHARKGFSPAFIYGINEDEIEGGVAHTDDLSYIFDSTGETDTVPIPCLGQLQTPRDIDFSRKYVQMIADFMSTGVAKSPFGSKPIWSPVTTEEIQSKKLNWMELDNRDDVALIINPFAKRMQFWDKLLNPVQERNEL